MFDLGEQKRTLLYRSHRDPSKMGYDKGPIRRHEQGINGTYNDGLIDRVQGGNLLSYVQTLKSPNGNLVEDGSKKEQ